MDKPTDIAGREINVGDTVVFSVYTRNGGLQVAEVLDVIGTPAMRKQSVFNEYTQKWDYHDEQYIEYKLKLKVKSQQYDYQTRKYEDVDKTRTLDDMGRFAVIGRA